MSRVKRGDGTKRLRNNGLKDLAPTYRQTIHISVCRIKAGLQAVSSSRACQVERMNAGKTDSRLVLISNL